VLLRSHGVAPVLFLAVLIWSGDTAAYYAGRAFGTRRLAPAVSPGKTVEGAVASVGASAVAAFLLAFFLDLPHGPFASVLVGIAVNVAAQLGDLAESLVKRCAGVKDSGTLFPGHGGMLDRADAFLLAGPVYALLLRL
jgi:phosphatidate cytidylyltransferase